MSINTISTITRREIRETLGDWRVALPIALLTFIVPLMFVGASGQVVRFVGDDSLAGRLVPFVVLLVGFLPASFSLITALETFVGERERNSLEALLAMPISDRDLYVSKLGSSITTPLVSSTIAMAVFTLLLYLLDPALYAAAMTAPRLMLLFLLVGCMALVMVAGSVVISSHITSVRAANLMSSFILVPMGLVIQLAAFLIINQRWQELWLVAAGLGALAVLLVRTGMTTFNREEILSREQTQGDWRTRFARWRPTPSTPKRRSFVAHPVVAIVQRELIEVVTDWRVLIPLTVLAIILPVGLVAGMRIALNFANNAGTIGQLVPFVALLAAFVPSSFSLITALESFVGERERNSLEALLAMPTSDRALYTGKLVSALTMPLAASLAAMLVFLGVLGGLFPELYVVAMTPLRILQLALLVVALTLVMVAGAVVISSHTASTRAATLLASFLLLPTSVLIQLLALLFIASRWDVVWITLAALVVIAIALIRTGIAAFNREEILSREHDQLSVRQTWATFRTFLRQYQPAGVVLSEYTATHFSPLRFYRRELPALLRDLRLPLVAALVAVLSGVLLGSYIGSNFAVPSFNRTLAELGNPPQSSLGLALSIFANNLRVALLSNLFSALSFGLFAFLVPAVAFGQISFVAATLQTRGGDPLQFLLAYVVPHGVIELPTFVLSAALGLRIGAALLSPPRGFTVGQNLLWAVANFLKVWLWVLLPLLLAGALVEGLVTPLVIAGFYC